MSEAVVIFFVCFVLYLNIVATFHLKGSEMYNQKQKAAQFILIWFIPIVGSALVLMLLLDEVKAEKRIPKGHSFITRFLLLSFIFSSATAQDTENSAAEVSDNGGGSSGE